jgi:glycosyltransferase involved in cell wall biosynthesis
VKVLHVTAGNLFGGVETSILALARYPRPGFDQEVAVFFEHERFAEELRVLKTRVHVLGAARLRHPWTVLRARKNLERILAEGAFDAVIVHSCWLHVIASPVIRECGRLLVFSVHDFLDRTRILERWASWTRPDFVLANSHATLGSVPGVFPGVSSAVLHPPVAPSPASSMTREEVRAKLGTAADAIVVIMASRLEPWKGHRLLLKAAATLDDRYSVWIAGGAQKTSEQAYLDELVANAPASVKFLGQRRDVRELMSAADIHCQPNAGPEPFGIVFIEALHAGLPVVTTRMGGALEIVDDTCGILVAPEPSRVAAALSRLADPEERRRLGAAGPARARSLCDPPRQAETLEKLLREVVDLMARRP